MVCDEAAGHALGSIIMVRLILKKIAKTIKSELKVGALKPELSLEATLSLPASS